MAHDEKLNSGDVPSAEEVARELAQWIYADMRANHADDMADPNMASPVGQFAQREEYLRAACDLAETAGPYAPDDLAAWIAQLQLPGFIEQIPNN